jgi:hypothetical protein
MAMPRAQRFSTLFAVRYFCLQCDDFCLQCDILFAVRYFVCSAIFFVCSVLVFVCSAMFVCNCFFLFEVVSPLSHRRFGIYKVSGSRINQSMVSSAFSEGVKTRRKFSINVTLKRTNISNRQPLLSQPEAFSAHTFTLTKTQEAHRYIFWDC